MSKDRAIIGRGLELEELHRAFDATRGGTGQVVFLAGEAGVGKTRLADEALAQSGLAVFRGKAIEDARTPYGPLAVALRDCLHGTSAADIDCGPLTPYLAYFFPERGNPPEEATTEILTEAIRTLFTTAAQNSPTLLFLDDLQWADDATLELLAVLSRRVQDESFLILGAYRAEEIPRGHRLRWLRNELRRTRQLSEISLEPLGPEDAAVLVAHVLEDRPSQVLTDLIFEKTQGLPLFIEELTGALLTSGRLRSDGPELELLAGESVPIPESIRDAVMVRMDTLSEKAHHLLEVAALAGMEFDLALVTEVAGGEDGLDELFVRSLIVEGGSGRGTFRHALTRDAVRSEIMWSRRRQMHREIAKHLQKAGSPPEQVVEHWLAANEVIYARDALLRSAERSCQLHAYRDAAAAAHRALNIWPEGDEEDRRLATLEQLARCAQISGQLMDAARALREVVESPKLREDHERRAAAYRSLATVYGLQGMWEQTLGARKFSAEAFEQAGLVGEASAELLAMAGRLAAGLQLDAGVEAAQRATKIAEQSDRRDIQARALGLQGNLLAMQGRFEEGREIATEGLSLALEHNLTEAASDVYRRLASTLEYTSDYPGAREAYLTALNFCRNHRDDLHAQVCLGCMSFVFFQTGEWKRALETSREVIDSPDSPPGSVAAALGAMGLVEALRGESRQGRKHLQESLSLARRHEIAALEMLVLWGFATLEEAEGAEDSAGEHYRNLLRRWEQTQDRHDAIPGLCAASTFFGCQNAERETALSAQALGSIASATGNPEALAGLAYALGETALLHGKTDEAVPQFKAALDQLEKLEIPLARAMTDYRLGVAYALQNDKKRAIQHLSGAYRTARKLGARPLAGRLADELDALGEPAGERRPSDSAARTGLTRRQKEIIELLGAGLTNKEIARKLYLSARTVDMHVGNILERLDSRTSTEAVRKASDLGLLPDTE